jgi:hypothetical protein
MEFLIGTVRFNNKTYKENYNWKRRKDYEGCAYGLDKPLSKSIPIGKYIYIIEMNNDINKIMGIGKIKNQIIYSNRSRMYDEERWNNFVYKSADFINRPDILKRQPKAEMVLKFLENILFRGSGHFKRGQGCLILSWDRISVAGNYRKTKRKTYICNTCGMKIKNHVCPGRKIKLILTTKKCNICGKTKKGHVCESLKKNVVLEKFIYNWFSGLFKVRFN